ncbi:hypothetical protein ACTFIZ_008441 [Dictyostelium cf. discoideum]
MPEEILFALTHQYEQCLLLPTLDLGPHVYTNQQGIEPNLIALILHQIWILICNQLYSEEKLLDSTLDYDNILKKWYKSALLEYIKKIKNFKIVSSKDTLSICDRNNYIKNIKNIKKQIVKEYCIPVSVLPNRVVIIEQFI